MEYDFKRIEQEWQNKWKEDEVYRVPNDSSRPKFYVLDMFPYPSGAGLHVGHPLGYIASDIYSRYKRLKGFNVLHPMGYDSFGLPAEQYALETGQHPAVTTENNIATFRNQLDKIGFSYDWSREVRTSDPGYYKWTQWIFLQIFDSWYNRLTGKAERISVLLDIFDREGSKEHPCPGNKKLAFSAEEWKQFDGKTKEEVLMNYRLTFSSYGEVNWCEALGTVLANDEVVNGVSERGGYPVEKKKMRQWYLRITEYADRLLSGLETVEFSEAMKEMQRNWIGKSQGAEMDFKLKNNDELLRVYTTRPDTIFGVDFMVIAPEHELVDKITTAAEKPAVQAYLDYVKSRSERERLAEVKQITGCFTGAYAINPFDGREIPIWIAEYVLAGYGTGAIMGVPCGDQRDFLFAKHFNIPISNIIGSHFNGEEANPTKDAVLENSGFLNGLQMKDAIDIAIEKIETMGIGKRQVNYKMRDAGFSRQRYWGEPFPIIWSDGIALALDAAELPLELPYAEKYGPGPNGEGPLANLTSWTNVNSSRRETSTMPGYAGSSWYFLRYMDPHNAQAFCDRTASDYWGQVDIYIGGTEHAVGHLLYSRMWTKILYDLGYVGHEEPFKKLVNQGMITGKSYFFSMEESAGTSIIRSYEKESPAANLIRFRYGHKWVDSTGKLLRRTFEENIEAGTIEAPAAPIEWLSKDGEEYIYLKEESEKMSKSKYNVDNPDELCEKYGADTFRMYEMFLGPVEASKPWDTKGIEGVHRFLRKLWRLFFDELKGKVWNEDAPTQQELKVLHRTIKKIEEDTDRFSFNTSVSTFMICVNELADLKCHKKQVLEPLLFLLAPYAPHISAELCKLIGARVSPIGEDATGSVYPVYNPAFLVESSKVYPISINGKVRTNLNIALDVTQQDVEQLILGNEIVQKWLDGKAPKKIIYVKNKMVNVVI